MSKQHAKTRRLPNGGMIIHWCEAEVYIADGQAHYVSLSYRDMDEVVSWYHEHFGHRRRRIEKDTE